MKEPLLDSPTTYEPPFHLHNYTRYNISTPPSYSSRHSSSSTCSFTPSPIAEEPQPQPKTQAQAQTQQSQPVVTRPRSRSKPSKIFIHPSESNLARADAAALQLGIGGDTELVKGNQVPQTGETAWKAGKGKVLARELMGRRSTIL